MTASFPVSVPTTGQLRGDIGDNVATFLSGDITDSVTTIPVDATADFPAAGLASIKKASGSGLIEVFSYTGKTANSFTGVTRDFNGKGAAPFSENDEVHLHWVADHHNRHVEETIAVANNVRNRFGLNSNIVIPNTIGKEFNGLTVLKSPSVGANNVLEIKNSVGAAIWDFKFTDATGALDLTPSTATFGFIINGRLRISAGSASSPGISFIGDENTGVYTTSPDTLNFATAGVGRWQIEINGALLPIGTGRLFIANGTAALPSIGFINDQNTGALLPTIGAFGIAADGVEVGRFDDNAVAGNTRFMIYDVDNATLERVTVGAADSGTAGNKVLQIPN